MVEVVGFSARVAPAEEANSCNQDKAELDKELAAVEPVHGSISQTGIGEEAVPKRGGGCEINRKVGGLPKKVPPPLEMRHWSNT